MEIHPLAILAIGIAIVVGLIVRFKVNAFVALILAATAVSLLAPVNPSEVEPGAQIIRMAKAFGATAGNIGIVIAMAALIGKCMMDSGAADRIVRTFLSAMGEKRSGTALATSGFVLSIPVFFDTVFYLLVPLARSLFRSTRKNYLKYVLAISAGAAVTHTVVPPTPGPLLVAEQLNVDVGMMILMGLAVGFPAACMGLLCASWMDKNMDIQPSLQLDDEDSEDNQAVDESKLPGLIPALIPIVLPVLMISVNTITKQLAKSAGLADVFGFNLQAFAIDLAPYTGLFGNPNFALMTSAAFAVLLYLNQCQPSRDKFAAMMEDGLMSAGVIILITAAGGAFGGMLKVAQVGPAIQDMFTSGETQTGLMLLPFVFGVSALLKFAQGSTTVAVITTSGMMAAMLGDTQLPFHPVYLATAIGGGGLIGSWMNDSGFWIFSKMGGLTEKEGLQTWTPLLIVLGIVSMAMTLVLATVMPLT
ncbi:MAG: GntP family permease [Limisphaerales bacterium]